MSIENEDAIETQRLKDEAAAEKVAADALAAQEAEALRLSKLSQTEKDADMVAKLVQDRLDSSLAPIKAKLDTAFQQRDEALAKLAMLEQKEKDATLRKLEEEGKHKEVFDIKLAEANAKVAALEMKNTELSRDVSVRDALKGLSFRSEKASEMAFKEITGNLVRNEQGMWIHRSGISVRDYCAAFALDDEQAFLFKAKANTGSGSNDTTANGGKPSPASNKSKSLFDLTQAEVIKMASEGKFGNPQQF